MIVTPAIIKVGSPADFTITLENEELDGHEVSIEVVIAGETVYNAAGIVDDKTILVAIPASQNIKIYKSGIIIVKYETQRHYGSFDVVLEPVRHSVTVSNITSVAAVREMNLTEPQLTYYISDAFSHVIRDLKNRYQNEFLYGVSDISIIDEMVTNQTVIKIIADKVRQQESPLLIQKKDREKRYDDLITNSTIFVFSDEPVVTPAAVAAVSSVRVTL